MTANADVQGLVAMPTPFHYADNGKGEPLFTANQVQAAIEAALSVAQGQGFVMVPRVPTDAILDVLFERMDETDEQLTEAWSRILSVAAAPAQPDGVE